MTTKSAPHLQEMAGPFSDVGRGQPAVIVSGDDLRIDDVVRVASGRAPVRVTGDPEVRRRVQASCDVIDRAIRDGQTIYGVNTPVGGMADRVLAPDVLEALQTNLLWMHKAGAGQPLALRHGRAAMLIRMNSHLRGASGIRLELIERLATFLNAGVTPHIPQFGSIGASGDLTPLSYIAGCVIGLDEAYTVDFQGESIDAVTALERLGLPRMELRAKEALAMMNGTSVSAGIAANCLDDARTLFALALAAHALMIQGLLGTNQSFHPFIHAQKPHVGQRWLAQEMLHFFAGSRLIRDELDGGHAYQDQRLVQDRYSLRCLPQYMGPLLEGLAAVWQQIEVEINAATDNPLIDSDAAAVYHGGNFLAQYVGLGLDRLRGILGLLAKHLDAQVALLMAPEFNFGLPPSLIGNTGRSVNLGLKALQLTGNSMMPLLTFFGNPLVDHFPTHAEQFNQNINSQSYGAGYLTERALDVFSQYIAVPLIAGVQSVDLRAHRMNGEYDARAVLSPQAAALYEAVREVTGRPIQPDRAYVWDDHDQPLQVDIARIAADIQEGGRLRHAVAPTLKRMSELIQATEN